MRRLKRDSLDLRVYGTHERKLEGLEQRRGQWIYIGVNTSDPRWTPETPPFLNAWVQDPSATEQSRFRHDPNGNLQIQLAVISGEDGTDIFKLPPEYCPESDWPVHAASADGLSHGTVIVRQDGTVGFVGSVFAPTSVNSGLDFGDNGELGFGPLTFTLEDGPDQDPVPGTTPPYPIDYGSYAQVIIVGLHWEASDALYHSDGVALMLRAIKGGDAANFIRFVAFNGHNGGTAGQLTRVVVDPNTPGVEQRIKIWLHTDSHGSSVMNYAQVCAALNRNYAVRQIAEVSVIDYGAGAASAWAWTFTGRYQVNSVAGVWDNTKKII